MSSARTIFYLIADSYNDNKDNRNIIFSFRHKDYDAF